jgi:hypothetical protein
LTRSLQIRFVLGLAAVGALLIFTVAVVYREELETAYQLRRLRNDPALLESMVLSDDRPALQAVRSFVMQPEGQEALFGLYLDECDRNQPGWENRDYLLRLTKMKVTHGSFTLWENGYSCQTATGTTGGSSFSLANVPLDPGRRKRILDLVDTCVGRTFRVEDLPHLEFRVVRIVEGKAEAPAWPGGPVPRNLPVPAVPPGARHVCFFRVNPVPAEGGQRSSSAR